MPHLSNSVPTFGFHVRRAARVKHAIDGHLFSIRGDLVFADFAAASRLAQDLGVASETLFALGLVHECLHGILDWYVRTHEPQLFQSLGARLRASFGAEYQAMLCEFLEEFPPPEVFDGSLTPSQFLARETDGISGETWALEELLLLRCTRENDAYDPIREVVTDQSLRHHVYAAVSSAAASHPVDAIPGSSSSSSSLEDAETAAAAAPALLSNAPTSLGALLALHVQAAPRDPDAQLSYLRSRFGFALADSDALTKTFRRLGSFSEERAALAAWHRSGSPGAFTPPNFAANAGFRQGPDGALAGTTDANGHGGQPESGHEEHRSFTQDRPWMPDVVLLAKSTFVWLVQLERAYQRPIRTLADIPEEELATIAARGINALWLIGLWKRSRASREIKRLMGNLDAAASAYSLDDYVVAEELGGDQALEVLRERASKHGIRLASDMVPNHMGIDSVWLDRHPEWFVSLEHPPYANYMFTGPDLGTEVNAIRLEDGYWHKSDAAVVFECRNRESGKVRYVYHGNDGTTIPWNDTAQLDILLPEVREALIQTVIAVAKRFPIIRFDAAMTLAKRHVRRLWHPPYGEPGGVPSRGAYALSEAEFDKRMPVEFWREVVIRVAAEAPDTLLLAEAFWMMEGYFVRTLGMHRVYNSAFMHMLKQEDNVGYRKLMKDVLSYDPDVLCRFVNFMNNPDEEPAKNQFGVFEKYFGICTLLATLPGLPMFGHGQFEGFGEKYGMEFTKPLWDESVDQGLLSHHERIIAPLLRRRALFAGSVNFRLYDFVRNDGSIDENVYAYSNRLGDARSLVVYRNGNGDGDGTLLNSAPFVDASGATRTESVHDALDLSAAEFWNFTSEVQASFEARSRHEVRELGFRLHLHGYECVVFTDIVPAGLPSFHAQLAVPVQAADAIIAAEPALEAGAVSEELSGERSGEVRDEVADAAQTAGTEALTALDHPTAATDAAVVAGTATPVGAPDTAIPVTGTPLPGVLPGVLADEGVKKQPPKV